MTAEATMSRYNSWMARPRGYRYGSWLTFYGCGAHVVGFSTANWLTSSRSDCLGLWSYCNRSSCWQISAQDSPDWIESTRVLDCIGVGLTALWVLIGCPCDCLKSQQQRYRRLTRLEEMVAILSGCFGLLAAGMLTFGYKKDRRWDDFSLSWSFWLVLGGACGSLLGGVVVAVTRLPSGAAPKPLTRCSRLRVPFAADGTISPSDVTSGTSAFPASWTDRGETASEGGYAPRIFSVFSTTFGGRETHGAELWQERGGANCWRDPFPPPPPYSASEQAVGVLDDAGETGRSETMSSPPPPYESCVGGHPPPLPPPPPYYYCNPYPPHYVPSAQNGDVQQSFPDMT